MRRIPPSSPLRDFSVPATLLVGSLAVLEPVSGQQTPIVVPTFGGLGLWQDSDGNSFAGDAVWLAPVYVIFLVSSAILLRGASGSLREFLVSDWTSKFQGLAWVSFLCTVFMIVGPGLMVLNKDIMQKDGFPYPLTLSSLGVVAATIAAKLLVILGYSTIRPEAYEAVAGWKWFKVALPIGACKAVSLAAGNAVYLYLGLGFIQMLKAFTPVVVLLVQCLLGSAKKTSRSATICIVLVVMGTLLEVKGELKCSILGLVLQLVAVACEAFNMVLTQNILQDMKFSIVEGMYILGIPSCLFLWFLAAFTEWPDMYRKGALEAVMDNKVAFSAAATLGLLVNWSSFSLIQATSSVFVKLLNVVRCILVVVYGVFAYGEEATMQKVVGYGIALVGFVGYNYVQSFPKSSCATFLEPK